MSVASIRLARNARLSRLCLVQAAVIACSVGFGSGPAAAESGDAFPDGLWVFGASCDAAAAGNAKDGIVLTRRGTQAPQSRCDFVQVLPGGGNRWAVIQLCTGRDSTFARISSLVLLDGGAAVLASENEGELEFDRCPDPPSAKEPAADDAGAKAPQDERQGTGN